MAELSSQEIEFLELLNAKIEDNIAREQFGVSELAEAMNMSRSNLLRKVKKTTNLSVSQLISQVRLKRAMELLRTTSLNVSEVSHEVGFNSTSYFIKCFREYYGYPPGEAGKRPEEPAAPVSILPVRKKNLKYWIAAAAILVAVGTWWAVSFGSSAEEASVEKSIVVLPFKNDSADSANVYIINGLMDATLNNLQKIKDLKVISRTSAEKYRNTDKTIPEIAKELNANYFVEGSGQKIDDRIVLNIQLIDGASDRHLWSRQYRREAKDIFELQLEISRDIAKEINAVITPEEKSRIEKIPTQNTKAYDSFLKGLDLLNKGGDDNLLASLVHFRQATEEDPSFALAYACSGIAYYYLDIFRSEKKYVDDLGSNADKALLYDPKLGASLTAKAMYYLAKKEYKQALPYMEKGLEYNPNSTQIIGMLADFYANYLPNTGKYLEYALMGWRLDAASSDSISTSFFYLRLGNALIQNGFIDESLNYIDKSIELYADNPYSKYVKAFVLYPKTGDLGQTRKLLQVEFRKDTTRFDVLQDIAKVSYYLREFDTAYFYYEKFNRFRETQKLDVYVHENMLIGVTYDKVGKKEEAREFIESYRRYLDTDQTVYRNLGLAMYHSYKGERSKALEYFQLFAKEDNIQYWVILFVQKDPILENIVADPEVKKVFADVDKRFWDNHDKLKLKLEEQGLLETR